MPDTRKQRRWLSLECLSKLKWMGGGRGLKYQRDVESHNGGLGAGYLYGSSAHEVVLKKFETHMF